MIKSNLPKVALLILFSIFLPIALFPQESIEEKLLENQEESSEQSELLEIILQLKEHPININTATQQELEAIPGLSTGLIVEIMNYRQKNGPFKSKIELVLVPGLDSDMFEYLHELVFIPDAQALLAQKTKIHWRTRVSNRMDGAEDVNKSMFKYSAQKIYHRMQFELKNKIRGGLLIEKDSGEHQLDDLRLFYLSAQISKKLLLLVGNYQLEFGQGLVLWGPYGFSKSTDSIYPIRKRERGIRGYSSVDENAAFWGSTVNFTMGPFQLVGFVSQNKLDANPVSEDVVSNLTTTGFHRDENEKSKKDVISESVVGGHVRYRYFKEISIGATYYFSSFDKKIYDPDIIRNRFKFQGKNNSVVGVDWSWNRNNFVYFGEFAQSQNRGQAFITGTQVDFAPMQIALLYRHYQKNFQNLHSFGFGERNGNTQNEQGYYFGLKYKLTPNTNLNAFYDIFKFPWSTYYNLLPTTGQEFLCQVEQKFGPHLRLMFRFRNKHGQETEKFVDEIGRDKKEITAGSKKQWRVQLDYRIKSQVRLRSRVEYVNYTQYKYYPGENLVKDKGFMMYQEVRYQPKKQWLIYARLSYFETDMNARIYQYEQDLPGVVTNQLLYGRGNRWFVLLKYKPFNHLNFSIKYAETFRNDKKALENLPVYSQGKLDQQFGIQMEMKL